MPATLTALGRVGRLPQVYHCICGCGRSASRGFPNDVWYAPTCLPPHLRFAHEPEYRPLPAAEALPDAAPSPAADTPDLLSGLVPA